MQRCPHCGGDAVSWGRKLVASAKLSADCRACDNRIDIPIPAILASSAPTLIAAAAAWALEPLWLKPLALLGGLILTCLAAIFWVPLARP